jgi:predicted Zn-dependent peptidase
VAEAVAATEVGAAGVVDATEPGVAREVLPNGVRVVTERMPGATSVSAGIWVGIGSRDEPADLAGTSHFLEHLLFKGTEERSARAIAVAVDALGGEVNAFTTRESTAFYARLPARDLAFGLQLLGDVVARPAFRPDEVECEREVILEELLMADDTPDDVVQMRLYEALFPGHPLGRETLGTPETVGALGRDAIAEFHDQHYRPANLVVAAAGDLDHDEVLALVAGSLAREADGERPERVAPAPPTARLVVDRRPTEQAHVLFGWQAVHYDDPDRYALLVANQILGGGISSRLFQEVREERGLAYTVYSSFSTYVDSGSFLVYAGTAPGRRQELLTVIDDVIAGMAADGVTEEEHTVALGFVEGSTLLGLEDSGSRMARIGGSELLRGRVVPVEEFLANVRAVTLDDVQRVLRRVLDTPRVLSAVGPFDADDAALQAAAARVLV